MWWERSAEIVDSKTPEVTLRLHHMFNLPLLAQIDDSTQDMPLLLVTLKINKKNCEYIMASVCTEKFVS